MAWLLRGAVVLVLSLLLLEASLRVAAWVARPDRSGEPAASDEALRILCAGDSHTLGAGVLRKWSYPAQLERRLAKLYWPHEVRVTNVGVAGANTAYVANRLDAFLAEYDPHLLILWVGINNGWNTAETRQPGLGAALESALMHSRVYRLVRVVLYTRRQPDFTRVRPRDWAKEEEDLHSLVTDVPLDVAAHSVSEDLESMIGTSRAAGVPVLLIDYPWMGAGDWLNGSIREAARAAQVPVIHTLDVFVRASKTHGPKALVTMGAGPHPSALLYRAVVDELTPTVASLLLESHGIEAGREAAAPRAVDTEVPPGG
jgi:lysophospholipase L1-like esterase